MLNFKSFLTESKKVVHKFHHHKHGHHTLHKSRDGKSHFLKNRHGKILGSFGGPLAGVKSRLRRMYGFSK